jgi:hypothetical protein
MIPKEKALELFYKYNSITSNEFKSDAFTSAKVSKQCALTAVDELIEATKKYVAVREKVSYSKTGFDNVVHTQYDNFWQQVKQEILAL